MNCRHDKHVIPYRWGYRYCPYDGAALNIPFFLWLWTAILVWIGLLFFHPLVLVRWISQLIVRFLRRASGTLRNGWAWAALVLAMLSLFPTPTVRLLAGLGAMVCGWLGWRRAKVLAGEGEWIAVLAIGGGLVALLALPESIPPSPPFPGCSTAALTAGPPANGSLTDSDCEAAHGKGGKADLYTFQGTKGQQVTIAMNSSAFDTYLILVGPDGSIVNKPDEDDDKGGDKNALINNLTLPSSGVYTIEATAYDSGGRGDYTLSLTQGNITASAPNGGENWPVGSTQTIRWNSSGISGDVRIELSRDGGRSWSALFGNTANDGSESWPVTGLATSRARIRVSSVTVPSIAGASDANFTISAAPCTRTQITPGQMVNGSLTGSDCEAPHGKGKKADLYTFQGTAGQQVTITMNSLAFDTFLFLVGPDGSKIDENDDIEGEKNKNSRIVHTLPRLGTYTIEATAYKESEQGAYSLSLQTSGVAEDPRIKELLDEAENLFNREYPDYKGALDRLKKAKAIDAKNEKVKRQMERIEKAWAKVKEYQ